MADNTYKVIELVGSSSESIDDAIKNAISRARQSLSHLDWFEVKEIRGTIDDDAPEWYQVKMGIGFRVLDADDVGQEP